MSEGCVPDKKDIPKFLPILKVYGQQKYMYEHKVHSVPVRCYILSSKSPQTLENAKFIASEFALRLSLVLYS